MGKGIAAIHVRRSHKKVIVQAIGQTPRGQSYLKQAVTLDVRSIADENFKVELAAAIMTIDAEPVPVSL